MKKSLFLVVCTYFFVMVSFAQDQLVGKWWSPEKDGQIEVYKKGNEYYGKLVWSKNPRKDTFNPDEKLRSRELVGMDIFTNFQFNTSNKEWHNGKIYDPKSGKTYSCKIWLSEDGKTMSVRGYIGISLLGRTERFTRV